MSRASRKFRAIAHPGLPDPLAARAAPFHAGLPSLAFAVFIAFGSGRSLVVLNLDDLGDAAVDRVPDRGAKVRKIGGRNGSGGQVSPGSIPIKQIFSKADVRFHIRIVHSGTTLPDAAGRGIHSIDSLPLYSSMNSKSGFSIRLMESQSPLRIQQGLNGL